MINSSILYNYFNTYILFNISPNIDNLFLDINKVNKLFQFACKFGYINIVKLLLLDDRVDPGANDNCAIRLASKNGHLEIVKLLLSDEQVDPSADNNYAIIWALFNDI
jgi:ankyrin repeat protein